MPTRSAHSPSTPAAESGCAAPATATRFVERMQLDFMDFAMLGDATATLEDGVLTLRVDLRARPAN